MDTDPAKEIVKVIWSLGDYEEVAKVSLPAAAELVDVVGVADGDEVLDVATGNGNVAVLAAQRGARVSACDLTEAMLQLAAARARREGLSIDFREGDVEDLPYEDGIFDHVMSTFGVMFAPRPPIAASELFRVTKPRGVVGLANWTPQGLLGRQIQMFQSYAPSGPPEFDPTLWGTDDAIAEWLRPHTDAVETARLRVSEEYESWDEVRKYYERSLGPCIALRQVLQADRYAALLEELRDLYASFNQASDGRIVVDSEYLRVVARKPG